MQLLAVVCRCAGFRHPGRGGDRREGGAATLGSASPGHRSHHAEIYDASAVVDVIRNSPHHDDAYLHALSALLEMVSPNQKNASSHDVHMKMMDAI